MESTLSLRQRQRHRPSLVKSQGLKRGTPAQSLLRAITLSEFCLSLRRATRSSAK